MAATKRTMRNKAITNLSTKELLDSEYDLLERGLKFITTPQKPQYELYNVQVAKFKRRIYCKMFFDQKRTNNEKNTKKKNPFSRPNPDWQPPTDKNVKLKRFFTIIENEMKRILSHTTNDKKENLRTEEFRALNNLKDNHNIIFKKCDKGGGLCLMDTLEYEQKVLGMLNDKTTYDELKTDPTTEVTKNITEEVTYMLKSLIISEKMAEFILPSENVRTPMFYGLPKVHKENVPLRPIVSGCEGPTDNISEYIVKYLQPMVETLPAYFKDTTHLLQILSRTPKPTQNFTLLTADVVSLYTNIPHDDGITAVENFIKNKMHAVKFPKNLPPIIPTVFLSKLLRIVLNSSSFVFGERVFHQKFGTAMGVRCAPVYANLFMGAIDENICNEFSQNIVIYKRFIDDILIIFTGSQSELDNLKKYMNTLNNNIKFTFNTSSTSIDFMDITLIRNPENNTISSTLYKKPTDTLALLNFHSNHPRHQKTGIIYSQALRYNRLISGNKNLIIELQNLAKNLILKGYPINTINTQFNRAMRISQKSLVLEERKNSKTTNKSSSTNKIPIVLPHDKIGREITNKILKHWHLIKNDPVLNNILGEKPQRVNTNLKSIGDVLIKTNYKSPTSTKQLTAKKKTNFIKTKNTKVL